MGLLEEARAAQKEKARRVYPCAVSELVSALAEQDATELEEALGDKTIDSMTLTAVLRARGHEVSHKQVQNHRGGRCPCARS